MNLFQSALNPVNAQVNRTMVQPNQGALSTRKAKPVGGKRNKNRGSNQLSAQDLISLFQSMPVPNRGFRNPNASKPSQMGQGMAWFDENNSPDKVAGRLDRQNTEDWKRIQRGNNMGAAAVDFVKQTKGYTGADGVFVPPTMPATPSSAYGTGSVSFTDKPTRGTMTDHAGRKVYMDQYLPNQSMVQDSKFGAMPGRENGGALARPRVQQSMPATQNDMSALFPGNSAPPVGQGTPPAPVGGDFWAWEQANRPPSTIGDVNPNEVPVTEAELLEGPGPSWFDRKVAANPDGIFGKIAEVGGMMPEMPQMPALSQNGVLPDLWNGLAAGALGVGDIYANTLGRPLDQFLFGIQPPAQPSNNMQQYQKSKNMKQGWW